MADENKTGVAKLPSGTTSALEQLWFGKILSVQNGRENMTNVLWAMMDHLVMYQKETAGRLRALENGDPRTGTTPTSGSTCAEGGSRRVPEGDEERNEGIDPCLENRIEALEQENKLLKASMLNMGANLLDRLKTDK